MTWEEVLKDALSKDKAYPVEFSLSNETIIYTSILLVILVALFLSLRRK